MLDKSIFVLKSFSISRVSIYGLKVIFQIKHVEDKLMTDDYKINDITVTAHHTLHNTPTSTETIILPLK